MLTYTLHYFTEAALPICASLSCNDKVNSLESLIEDGHAEVCCHFCNERYAFSKEELQAIYDKAMANRSHAEA